MALNKRSALKALCKELEKNYLLQRACNKLGLTRSTVYRWMNEDKEFASAIRIAQNIGRHYMSDFVESKLFKNIEDREQRAIEFWLKGNNERYRSHEKALERKLDAVKHQLRESELALSQMGGSNILSAFIDWPKVTEYLRSDEWMSMQSLRMGIVQENNPNDKLVLKKARQLITQMQLAEEATKESIALPKEDIDLID
jgi:predicted DNA-binding transcriptional regulator AlpA